MDKLNTDKIINEVNKQIQNFRQIYNDTNKNIDKINSKDTPLSENEYESWFINRDFHIRNCNYYNANHSKILTAIQNFNNICNDVVEKQNELTAAINNRNLQYGLEGLIKPKIKNQLADQTKENVRRFRRGDELINYPELGEALTFILNTKTNKKPSGGKKTQKKRKPL